MCQAFMEVATIRKNGFVTCNLEFCHLDMQSKCQAYGRITLARQKFMNI